MRLARGVEARGEADAKDHHAHEQQRGADDDNAPRRPPHIHAHAGTGAVVDKDVAVVGVVVEQPPEPEVVLVHIFVAAVGGGQPLLRAAHGELRGEAEGDEREHIGDGEQRRPKPVVAQQPEGDAEGGGQILRAQQHLAPVVAPHARQCGVQVAVRVHHVRALAEDERIERPAQQAHESHRQREQQRVRALRAAGDEPVHGGHERNSHRRDEKGALQPPARVAGRGLHIDDHAARVGRAPALGGFQRAQLFVRPREKDIGQQHRRGQQHQREDEHAFVPAEEHHGGEYGAAGAAPEPLRPFEAPHDLLHAPVVLAGVRQRDAEDDVLLHLRLVGHQQAYERQHRPEQDEEDEPEREVTHFRAPLRDRCPGRGRGSRPRPCRPGGPRRR